MLQRHSFTIAQFAFVAFLIAIWKISIEAGWADTAYVGDPFVAGDLIVEWIRDGTIFRHAGATLLILVLGFGIGTLLGVAIGAVMGASRLVRDMLEPFVIFFNGMPRLILQPFFIIWLGFGLAPKVALVVAVIVVIIAINTADSVREVNRGYVDNVKLSGGNRFDLLRHVYLPSMTLSLLATSRTNVGFAFQAALVSEFVGANIGLGYLIVRGQSTFSADIIWAALVIVIFLSVLIDYLISKVETWATQWMN